jgi:hypothetical protein
MVIYTTDSEDCLGRQYCNFLRQEFEAEKENDC